VDIVVTIPAGDVADLQAYAAKRLAILYPQWDTTGMDVLQIFLDDFAEDQWLEAHISVARWAVYEASTDEERIAAQQAENAARDAKLAMEASRAASRVSA